MTGMWASAKGKLLYYLPEGALLELRKRHYLRRLKQSEGSTEEAELAVMERFVRRGDHVADVGANFGSYTTALSKLVGTSGRVYSFEPVPSTFEVLRFVVRKLGLRNIELYKAALSDHVGKANMDIPTDGYGAPNYYQASLGTANADTPHARRVEVAVTTLDSSLAVGQTRISLVKVDVEGYEAAVIRGAEQVIARWRPVLLVEAPDDPDSENSRAAALFLQMAAKDYRAWVEDRGSLRLRKTGDRRINYFFVPCEVGDPTA